ncbi:hypothetical protein J3R82DRAFT_7666 [Butyriboletus roseoflavus]|nr:hypothetical protein J3R82DRAFT_7666 [Butyriboletus roseoflavus]
MLPSSSRYMSGVARPRDLRVVTRSRAGHLRLDHPDTDERVPDFQALQRSFKDPEAVDATQWPSPHRQIRKSVQGPEARAALLCEISPVPLNDTEVPQSRSTPVSHINPCLLAHQPSFASHQARGFHSSLRVPYDSTSYNVTDVPEFFVKYKDHRATLSADLEVHELGLMQSLANSIRSGDVVASTRRLKAKIPVEHHATEGRIVHPSGFVVPGPGHSSTSDVARAKERERNENKDRAVQTAAVADRVLESDFGQVDATTHPSLRKVPFEVHELDGTVKHPSGFVPPTPAHKFRYTVDSNVLRDRKVSAVRQRARQPSPARAVLRAMHTTSAPMSF